MLDLGDWQDWTFVFAAPTSTRLFVFYDLFSLDIEEKKISLLAFLNTYGPFEGKW
jgi:hypothetical protein